MDMKTGRVEFLISLKRMAEIAFPQGYQGKTNLYFFREGWNPSGTRFIAFLKNADRPTFTGGWSISADGKDCAVLLQYPQPSCVVGRRHDPRRTPVYDPQGRRFG